jgi:hypothetical protein
MTDISNNIINFFIHTLTELEVLLYNDETFVSDKNILAVKRHIQNFLISKCDHVIENDIIEIEHERMQHIRYCKKCMLNL